MNNELRAIDAALEYIAQSVDQIRQVAGLNRKLLMVLIKGGEVHQINGYVHGRTSEGDPFVCLYSSHPKMEHKVCRVYSDKFHDLPYFVRTNNIPANAQDGNPSKSKAQQQGIYHNCSVFMIATRPGKETNMGPEKRFYMTLELTRNVDDELKAAHEKLEDLRKQVKPLTPARNGKPKTPAEIIDEPETPAEEIDIKKATQEVNELLGLGDEPKPKQSQKEHEPMPEEPFKYKDGTDVPTDSRTKFIFMSYWNMTGQIAENSGDLKKWYDEHKMELIETDSA